MASEHILLSSEKYDRIMRRLKDCESRDPVTESPGEQSETGSDRVNADIARDESGKGNNVSDSTSNRTSSSSRTSSSEQTTSKDKLSENNFEGRDDHNSDDDDDSGGHKGDGTMTKSDDTSNQRKQTENKEKIITKRDLMQKLRPPGNIVGRGSRKRSSYPKSTKGPSRQNKGNKKRKWETL